MNLICSALRLRQRAAWTTALLTLLFVSIQGAHQAHSHEGRILLDVRPESSNTLTVHASWSKDRHPVKDAEGMSFVAESSTGGSSHGPITMVPLDGHPGDYKAASKLPQGTWTVTFTLAKPQAATMAAEVIVGAPHSTTPSAPHHTLEFLGPIAVLAVAAALSFAVLARIRSRNRRATDTRNGI